MTLLPGTAVAATGRSRASAARALGLPDGRTGARAGTAVPGRTATALIPETTRHGRDTPEKQTSAVTLCRIQHGCTNQYGRAQNGRRRSKLLFVNSPLEGCLLERRWRF